MHPGEKYLAQLRVVHWVFLASVVVLATVAELAAQQMGIEAQEQLVIVSVLAVLAITEIAMGTFMRRKNLDAASETLRRAPEDQEGWQKWRAGTLLGFTFAETICLFGVAARLVANSLPIAIPFYVVSLLLLLVWSPRLPD